MAQADRGDSMLSEFSANRDVTENWQALGEDANRLLSALAKGKVPQSMLLVGEPDVTLFAAHFVANYVLCTGGANQPCGQCEGCLQFRAASHPNFHETPTDGNSVKTRDIEDLQGFMQMRSHGKGPLVYIVNGLDSATPVAANRLLKTLEDPVSHMVAILTARNARQVLPTILSRSQVFRLQKNDSYGPNDADGTDDIHNNAIMPSEKSEEFAALFERVVQWSQTLLQDAAPPLVLANEFDKFEILPSGEGPLDILIAWLSDVLHYGVEDERHLRFRSFHKAIELQAKLTSSERIAKLIQIALAAKVRKGSHVVGLLNAEQMCIRMRRVQSGLHGGGSPF